MVITTNASFGAGLVNYCVPAGEAYSKALAVARDINEKVSPWDTYHAECDTVCFMPFRNAGNTPFMPFNVHV